MSWGRWRGGTVSTGRHGRCQQAGATCSRGARREELQAPGELHQSHRSPPYTRPGELGTVSTPTFSAWPAAFAAYVTRNCCVPTVFCAWNLSLLGSCLPLFALCHHHLSPSFPHRGSAGSRRYTISLTAFPLVMGPSPRMSLIPGTLSCPSCQHHHPLKLRSFPSNVAFSSSSSNLGHFWPI